MRTGGSPCWRSTTGRRWSTCSTASGATPAPDAQRAIKRDITDTVGRDASAVLLDPDVSVEHMVDSGALGDGVGLIVRIEADGYDVAGGLRESRMIDGLGAAGALARQPMRPR